MMQRDFDRLQTGPFDLLVVGGGIYGAWTAYDAALRGLKVALVEKKDWAAATSSASSKLIHGGLRYLEYARFGLVRRALQERRRLWRLAPHRVWPLRFALPLYKDSRVGRGRLKLGLWLYDRLAGGQQPVPGHRYLGREAMCRRYEFLQASGLSGGFLFGDCQTDDARTTLEIVAGAMQAGAVAVNHAPVLELIHEDGRVTGAVVEDEETGQQVTVQAAVTANCAGPWSRELSTSLPEEGPFIRLSKGVHLVMPPLPTSDAFLLTARESGRIVLMLPWYGRTLVGTTDTDHQGRPGRITVEPHDVDYLLAAANQVLSGVVWKQEDVISTFAGLRTLPVTPDDKPSSVTREFRLDERGRLLTPVGGKFTSARVDAAKVVDRVVQILGHGVTPCQTETRPFPWCPPGPEDSWTGQVLERGKKLGLDAATLEGCLQRYGSRLESLYTVLESEPDLSTRVHPETPFCLGEIVLGVREEMARTLEDVLRRRLPLLLVARLPQSVLETAAALAGEVLGWSASRRQEEVAAVTRHPSVPVHETV